MYGKEGGREGEEVVSGGKKKKLVPCAGFSV